LSGCWCARVCSELVNDWCDDRDSIDVNLQVFADLSGGRRVVADHDGEPPRLMLGLKNVARAQRLQFVRSHLREAYLDPVAGDPVAWRALIAALGDEGLSCGVATLRALPFAVELGPCITAALGET
jgi:hypothetical protein